MTYKCSKGSTYCEFYDLGECHNVEDCVYAIADNVKRSPFKHRETIQLAHEMERNNTYANALIAENKRLGDELAEYNCDTKIGCPLIESIKAELAEARLDCAVAEANHMRTLERFLEAQERITELTAERDALVKSIRIVSEPIETIQPRGITE